MRLGGYLRIVDIIYFYVVCKTQYSSSLVSMQMHCTHRQSNRYRVFNESNDDDDVYPAHIKDSMNYNNYIS